MNTIHSNGKPGSMLIIAKDIYFKEGLVTFFRGWLPAYLRLGPHALICFPVFEQIRKALGLNYI
jgi:dicarboxylate transporter 10